MNKMRMTVSNKALIAELVDVIAEMLPLTSRSSNTITFTTIFKGSKVGAYVQLSKKKQTKKQVLQPAFEEIFKNHSRLRYGLIRKIVPASVAYRRYKRNPLCRAELDKLSACLFKLGVDMRKELAEIELDETIPLIQVPPAELIKRLENHPLSEQIASEPLELFRNGHFNESVRKATERFEVIVQELTGSEEIGKGLMGTAFAGKPTPRVCINPLSNKNELGAQEGYSLMTMGMMQALRNIFSHGDEDQRSPEEAFEMLLLVNWFFRQLPEKS